MPARTLQPGIVRRIAIRHRLERGCTSSLLFLLVVTTQPSLEEAARFSGLHKSQCSKMLKAHSKGAVSTLESLSKQQAQPVSQARQKRQELPGKMALVVESTLQQRARLPPANAKTFNHGQGCGVGHQWTPSVLILNAMLIPLRPIPFSRQRSGRDHALAYRTEHALVGEDIQPLTLEDSLGSDEPREVVVFTDRGYDNTKSQTAIADKHWPCMIALGHTRSGQSVMLALTTPQSKPWGHMAPFLRHHRRLTWHTIRITTHGTKRKRRALRTRDTLGDLR
jgi:hypothetical protein